MNKLFGIITLSLVGWLGLAAFTAMGASPQTVLSTENTRFQTYPSMPDMNNLLNQVNRHRLAQGLRPVVADLDIANIAQQRATDMKKQRYYAHGSPDGSYYYDLLEQAGLRKGYSCENLNLSASPKTDSYVADWLNSKKGHKECLLSERVSKAGFAITQLPPNSFYGIDAPQFIVVTIYTEK